MPARDAMGAEGYTSSLFRKLSGWVGLRDRVRDYDLEKAQNSDAVIARFARGNVLFQNGAIMDEEGLKDLAVEGDAAAAKLRRYAPKN